MFRWLFNKIEEYKLKRVLRDQDLEEELFQQNLKNLWLKPEKENKNEQ